MFEESLPAETVLMEAPLKATAARQGDAGRQGRHVCPWGCLCGSVASCKPPGSFSHAFMLIVPIWVQGLGKHPSKPRQQAHTATPSAMHTPKCRQTLTSFHIQWTTAPSYV